MGPHEAAARALAVECTWPLNTVSITIAKALLAAAKTLDEHPDGFYPFVGPVRKVRDALAAEIRECRPTPNPLDELRAVRWVCAARSSPAPSSTHACRGRARWTSCAPPAVPQTSRLLGRSGGAGSRQRAPASGPAW